jgi:CRISPR-associated exonuclease Cas4
MGYIFFVLLLLIFVGILLVVVHLRKRSFGTLSQEHIYSDAGKMPGSVLFSDSFLLKGKPDYIVKKGNEYIPVEVKTGKTPTTPYKNHVMQLIAYCVLVEENYGQRPKIGVIKYPENEFTIEYTDERKIELKNILSEMREIKKSGREPICSHPEHQVS